MLIKFLPCAKFSVAAGNKPQWLLAIIIFGNLHI